MVGHLGDEYFNDYETYKKHSYGHLYTVPFDPMAAGSAEAARVTEGDFHVTGFDWSPDGTRLVFAHQADPRINTGRLSGDIAWGGSPEGLRGPESPLARPRRATVRRLA